MGRKVPFWQVIICIVFALAVICYSIFFSYGEAHMPMILAAAVVAIVALCNGWKWSVIEKGMVQGINRSMQANLLLLLVGILVATWKAGGIIPSMIYYGLNIIRPSIFLVTACLLCSLVSLVIGSSYTTAGTIGVAMIGIAIGLGISPAMTAGAVVSGAYFGDKMSPMSDTTNLAPAVAGSTIFDHIRHMIYTVTPTYIIALIVFFFLGRNADTGEEVQMEMKDILQDAMQNEFVISPWLMLPVVFLLVAVILKMPAIPAMFCAVVMGLIPWNVCGATMTGFLGVSTIEYAKYAVVNYVCPVISIIYGFTGFSIKKMSDEEYEKVMEQREEEEKALQRDLEA